MATERDIKEFRFQQLCKVKVSEKRQGQSSPRSQLLACSSTYGLTFIGCPTGFKVLKTSDISHKDAQHPKDKTTVVINDCPIWLTVSTQQAPCYLALNCDDQLLMVVMCIGSHLITSFYSINSFSQQGGSPAPITNAQLDGSGLIITDTAWNPTIPSLLAVCLSDGSVALLSITDKVSVTAKLPPATQATCLCWSPKGKQLVVGKHDGTFSQYDQALTEKKKGPFPNCLPSQRFKMIDILWESTFMFIGSFISLDAGSSDQPQVIMINTPKDGGPSFIDLEDPCYGSGENCHHKFYKTTIPKWEMILLSSASSSSLAILGKNLEVANSAWEKWNLDDNGRAELPLDEDYADTFPVGMAIDYSSQMTLTLADKSTISPCPILLLLTTDGVLIPFYMIYALPNVPNLITPPQPLPGGITPTGIPTATPSAGFSYGAAASQSPLAMSEPRQANIPSGPSPQPAGLFKSANQNAVSTSSVSQTPATVSANQAASFSFGQGFSFGQSSQSSAGISFGRSGPSMAFVAKPQVPSASPVAAAPAPASVKPISVSTASSIGQSQLVTSLTPGSSAAKPAPSQARPTSIATPQSQLPVADHAASFSQPAPVTQQVSPTPAHHKLSQPGQAAAARFNQSLANNFQQQQEQQITAPGNRGSSPVSNEPAVGQNNDTINQAVDSEFTHSMLEELAHFEQEIRELRSRARGMNTQIGAPQEKEQLTRATNTMCKFVQDVRDNTEIQLKEIHDLKAQTLDMFASVEQCRMRLQRNKDQHYQHLLQARALDPSSAQKKRHLEQQYQFVENTARDVELVLDHQWEEYQEQKKTKNRSIRVPRSDLLYRTVKSNQSLIISQQRKVESMRNQLKQLQLFNSTTPWDSSQTHLNGNSTVNERELDLSSLSVSATDQSRETASKSVCLNPERVANLRDFLCRRSVSKVKSTRPTNWLMSKIVSAAAVSGRLNASSTEISVSESNTGFTTPRSSRTEKGLPPRTLGQPVNLPDGPSGAGINAAPTLNRAQQGQGHEASPTALFGQQNPSTATSQQKNLAPRGPARSISAVSAQSSSSSLLFGAGTQSASETSLKKIQDMESPVVSDSDNGEYLPGYGGGDGDGLTPQDLSDDEYDDEDDDQTEDDPADQDTVDSYSDSELRSGTSSTLPKPFDFSRASQPPNQTAPGAFFMAGSQSTEAAPKTQFGATAASSKTASFGLTSFNFSGNPTPQMNAVAAKSGRIPTPQMTAVAAKSAFSGSTENLGQSGTQGDKGPNPAAQTTTTFSLGTGTSGEVSAFGGQGGLTGLLGKSEDLANPTSDTISTVTSSFRDQSSIVSGSSQSAENKPKLASTQPQTSTVFGGRPTEFSFGAGSSSGFSFGQTAFGRNTANVAQPTEGRSVAQDSKESDIKTVTAPVDTGAISKSGSTLFGTGTSAVVAGENLFSGIASASNTTATTSSGGLFGSSTAATTSSEGLFGSTNSATTVSGGLFGSSTTATTSNGGLFGSGTTATTSGGLFGSKTTAITTSGGLFGSGTTATTASESLFKTGTTTTTADGGLFVSSTTTSTASGGLFGNNTTAATTSGSLFGTGTITTEPSGGIFVSGTAASTANGGIFGSSNTETTTSGGIFGSGTITTAAKGGLFGSSTPAATTTGGKVGSSTTDTTSGAGLFSSGSAPDTNSGGLFGSGTAATTASGGLFGSSTTATTASGGLFGSSTIATTASGGLFGSSTATTTASGGLFGSSTATTTATGGLFGSSSNTTTASGGLFGSSTAATTASGSLFGSSTAATTASGGLFGSSTNTTTASGGLFGSSTTATTASGGLFGSSTTGASSNGGLFGSNTSTSGGSVFGNSSSTGGLFGSSNPTSGGVFAPTSSDAPVFGSAPTSTTGGSVFNQNTATSGAGVFGSTTASSGGFGSSTPGGNGFGFGGGSSGGGGFLGGLGGKPTAESASKNVFSTPAFGTPTTNTTSTNLFGNQGATSFGSAFGSPSTAASGGFGSGGANVASGGFGSTSAFGSGGTNMASAGFGSPGGNVASSGFGVNSPTQQASFGGSPVFGSNPQFGGSPAFGSAPAFGSRPVFGSSTFGSSPTPSGGGVFGSTQPTAGGFAGMAGSTSPTFGSLAQGSGNSGFGSPGFGGTGMAGGMAGGNSSGGFGGQGFGSSQAFTGYRS